MWVFKWVLSAVLILIILGFALQNQQEVVRVHIVNWTSVELPLYFVIYISFAFGLFTWLLTSIFKIMQLKSDCRQLKKQGEHLQEELNKLRNLTVEEAVSTSDIEEQLEE